MVWEQSSSLVSNNIVYYNLKGKRYTTTMRIKKKNKKIEKQKGSSEKKTGQCGNKQAGVS